MSKTYSGVLESLSDTRLLSTEAYETLTGELIPVCTDWTILGPELIYRGWFTPFQMKQILAGEAESLILGSYVLLDPLGEGGMGRVYRARNWKIDKIVAIKVTRQERALDRKALRRFFREIEAIGTVSHPNIILAFDAEFVDDTLFYVMEYIPGHDLGWQIRQYGPLSVPAACYFMTQISHALQHVFEKGFVHRDIKPSNLLLTQNRQSVKLLDLGLTRYEFEDDDKSRVTRLGSLLGTPDYIAPEQILAPREADIRSDLYSLGCTLYYLLAGRAPFEHVTSVEKLYHHIKEEIQPIRTIRPDVPRELQAILFRLLNKRPDDRFQQPIELLQTLLPFVRSSWKSTNTTLHIRIQDGLVWDEDGNQIAATDPSSTQEVVLSDLDFILPGTTDKLAVEPVKKKWFHPIRMIIALLLAILAILAIRFIQLSMSDSMEENPTPEQKLDAGAK
jgi:eukaryotic-like serine/threonine-protein kinase